MLSKNGSWGKESVSISGFNASLTDAGAWRSQASLTIMGSRIFFSTQSEWASLTFIENLS